MSEIHPLLTSLSGACAEEPAQSDLADKMTVELYYKTREAGELLTALKEAQYFIQAPAEDMKDGVLSRIREAISKAEFPKPDRNRAGKEPCGECHIQPGETCDICGASKTA